MHFHLIRYALALILAICAASALWAQERRVALVIGNSIYDHVPRLINPANDADDIAAALEQMGFDVTLVHDLDDRGMRLALRDFGYSTGEDAQLFFSLYDAKRARFVR